MPHPLLNKVTFLFIPCLIFPHTWKLEQPLPNLLRASVSSFERRSQAYPEVFGSLCPAFFCIHFWGFRAVSCFWMSLLSPGVSVTDTQASVWRMSITSWCVTASITPTGSTVKSVSLSSTTGRGGGRLPRVPANACVSAPWRQAVQLSWDLSGVEEGMGDLHLRLLERKTTKGRASFILWKRRPWTSEEHHRWGRLAVNINHAGCVFPSWAHSADGSSILNAGHCA